MFNVRRTSFLDFQLLRWLCRLDTLCGATSTSVRTTPSSVASSTTSALCVRNGAFEQYVPAFRRLELVSSDASSAEEPTVFTQLQLVHVCLHSAIVLFVRYVDHLCVAEWAA